MRIVLAGVADSFTTQRKVTSHPRTPTLHVKFLFSFFFQTIMELLIVELLIMELLINEAETEAKLVQLTSAAMSFSKC